MYYSIGLVCAWSTSDVWYILPAAIQEKYENIAAHEAPSIQCTLTVASVDQIDDICQPRRLSFQNS